MAALRPLEKGGLYIEVEASSKPRKTSDQATPTTSSPTVTGTPPVHRTTVEVASARVTRVQGLELTAEVAEVDGVEDHPFWTLLYLVGYRRRLEKL